MPYLPVDLDAKRKAALLDKALGLSTGHIVNGLLEAWEIVWRAREQPVNRDRISTLQMVGCFGMDPRIPAALVEQGFLEPLEGMWRVRGAGKWLYQMEGKSRGGHASKGNLIPGAVHLKKAKAPKPKKATKTPENAIPADEIESRPILVPSASIGSAEWVADGVAEPQPIGRPSALTPNTQHPTASLKTSGEKPVELVVVEIQEKPPDPAREGGPEYVALVQALFAEYREVNGVDPEPSGRDWAALKRLRKRSKRGDPEIILRLRRGLRGQFKTRVDSFFDLEVKWDALASESAQTRPKGSATDGDKDHSRNKLTESGDLDFMAAR